MAAMLNIVAAFWQAVLFLLTLAGVVVAFSVVSIGFWRAVGIWHEWLNNRRLRRRK